MVGEEAEGFVEGAGSGAGVERDAGEAAGAAPIHHDLENAAGEALAARMGFGIHVENPGALRKSFGGMPGPTGEDDAAAGDEFAGGEFGEPGFVGGVLQGVGEIFTGGLIHAVENGRVPVAHVFKHGAAVTDEMGKILEERFANKDFHGYGFWRRLGGVVGTIWWCSDGEEKNRTQTRIGNASGAEAQVSWLTNVGAKAPTP